MRFAIGSIVGSVVAGSLLAVMALACDTAWASDDASRATIERRAREVLDSGPYQTELADPERRRERADEREGVDEDPGRDPDGIPKGERRSRRSQGGASSGGGGGFDFSWLAGLGPVIVVVVCAVIALFVGYLLMNLPRGSRAKATLATPEMVEVPAEGIAVVPLDDPDRLAADGRFDLAIHAALLCAIDRVASRVDCGAARTTREILGDRELDGRIRDPFGRLAVECERTLFGGRPADAQGYARARSALDAIPATAANRGAGGTAGADEASQRSPEEAASRGGKMS